MFSSIATRRNIVVERYHLKYPDLLTKGVSNIWLWAYMRWAKDIYKYNEPTYIHELTTEGGNDKAKAIGRLSRTTDNLDNFVNCLNKMFYFF